MTENVSAYGVLSFSVLESHTSIGWKEQRVGLD